MIRRGILALAVVLTILVGSLTGVTQASAYTCDEWLGTYNGLWTSNVYCEGRYAPAPYFYNKTHCRQSNGLYYYTQGNTRKVGGGSWSIAYCPKGMTIQLDHVNVGWRTSI